MNQKYTWKWWNEDHGETEEDAREVLEYVSGENEDNAKDDAEEVAENVARRNFDRWDYAMHAVINLRSPKGQLFVVDIEVRSEPHFYGTVRKEKP